MKKLLLCLLFTLHCFAHDIKAVAFDFGGVVATVDVPMMARFLCKTLHLDKNQLKIALNNMNDFLAKGGSEMEYWQSIAASKNIVLSDNWSDDFEKAIDESVQPIPETVALIAKIKEKGYQTALLSNMTQIQSIILAKKCLFDYFDPCIFSFKINVEKPHKEAYLYLLNELNKEAHEVIFIDDRIENVEAAQELGIHGIHFTTPQQVIEQLKSLGVNL